jgi:hypothetical protein
MASKKQKSKPATRRAPPASAKAKPRASKKRTWRQRLHAGEQVSGKEILDEMREADPEGAARSEREAKRMLEAARVAPLDCILPGTPVFVAWTPGPRHDEKNRKRGVLVEYNRNGKARVQIARVDAKGNYTGEIGSEVRSFEPDEVWPINVRARIVTERHAVVEAKAAVTPKALPDADFLAAMAKLDGVGDDRSTAAAEDAAGAEIAERERVASLPAKPPRAPRKKKREAEMPAPAPTPETPRADAAAVERRRCNCGGVNDRQPIHIVGVGDCRFDEDGGPRDASAPPPPPPPVAHASVNSPWKERDDWRARIDASERAYAGAHPDIDNVDRLRAEMFRSIDAREAVAARCDELNAEPRGRTVGPEVGKCRAHGISLRATTSGRQRVCRVHGCEYYEVLDNGTWRYWNELTPADALATDVEGAEAPPPWE